MTGRVLYVSLVDISLPYGPGVNELGFLRYAFARLEGRVAALIPAPSRSLPPDLQGLRVMAIPCGTSSVRNSQGWTCSRLKGGVMVRRALHLERPELVVMRPSAFPLPQWVVALTAGAPHVLKTAGDAHLTAFYRSNPLRRALRPWNAAMFRTVARTARAIDVVSEDQKAGWVSLCPSVEDRVVVIDNGVDLDQFGYGRDDACRQSLGFTPEDVVVGYVGNYPFRRGGRDVVHCVAALRDLGVRGLIVGDSGEAGKCRRLAHELGVEHEVRIVGQMDFPEVPRIMKAMDIGVSVLAPSERGASEQKVRQYLATGLCVVGTAGSNDFLRGMPFARVLAEAVDPPVEHAVRHFVELGADARQSLGKRARRFAEERLSLAARHEQRFMIWQRALQATPS